MTLRSRNLHRPSPDVRPTEPRPTPRRQRSPAAGRSCAALVLVCLGFSLLLGHHVLDRKGGNRPVTGPRSESVNSLGFAWGSLIAPYHPNGPVPRGLPVQIMPRRARSLHRPVEVCIVTTELAGLHKTGGIGTAFLELAKLLAPLKDFAVTVVVTHARREFAPSAVAVQERLLRASGIELLFLPQLSRPSWPHSYVSSTSYATLQFFLKPPKTYDVVHFSDNNGLAFYTLLAKRQGWAATLQKTAFVVGLHGPDVSWAALLNKRYPSSEYALELDHFERRSVELADYVVSPSQYMLDYLDARGWRIPHERFLIRNVLARPSSLHAEAASSAVNEVVFFGRLEIRKGLRLFLDAFHSLLLAGSDEVKSVTAVTFLGRLSLSAKEKQEFDDLCGAWKVSYNASFAIRVLADYDRASALEYISRPGRLAIVPSLNDNLPYTVMECLELGVRFLASAVGGIPELIVEQDRDATLFRPTPKLLAAAILRQLGPDAAPWRRSRPTFSLDEINESWIAFHRHLAWRSARVGQPTSSVSQQPLVSVAVIHHERPNLLRQAVHGLLAQTYRDVEIVVLDDGTKDADALVALAEVYEDLLAPRGHRLVRTPNNYLGEARNHAARYMRGKYLLFLDDDDVLKPYAVQRLVQVAESTAAQALSSFLDEFRGENNPLKSSVLPERRTYLFLGPDLALGSLRNCFGSGNIFVTRRAFDAVGGFSTYGQGVGAEDWEFYVRLALANLSHSVVPDPLVFTRSDAVSATSMKFTMDPWLSEYRALAPLLDDPRIRASGLSSALLYARGVAAQSVAEKEVDAVDTSSSRDFSGLQGHKGWLYSFRNATDLLQPPITNAVFFNGRWLAADADTPWPYIAANALHPQVSSWLGPVAAVKSYIVNEDGRHLIAGEVGGLHPCGDGTEVKVIAQPPHGSPEELLSVRTLDQPRYHLEIPVLVTVGTQIHVAAGPLVTDSCDAVAVEVVIKHQDGPMAGPTAGSGDALSTLQSLRAAHSRVLAESKTGFLSPPPPSVGTWSSGFRNGAGKDLPATPPPLEPLEGDRVQRLRGGRDIPYVSDERQHSTRDVAVYRGFTFGHSFPKGTEVSVLIDATVAPSDCVNCGDGVRLDMRLDKATVYAAHLNVGEAVNDVVSIQAGPGSVLEVVQSSGGDDRYDSVQIRLRLLKSLARP